ncbi:MULTISPECIES: M16 family metallopeptidase [Pseudomonas syringae group]|nr:pitrilysin family protein [Pseudomonas viridiflava]MCF9018678.1 insulinase family protein [Pseudomonas syringae]MEE3917078.1 pitrilysin family protein [Pseudomonas viridiflava]MEE3975313.1 pitrilysin family protein [Pseudomonas viridiflava]MEE4020105.1 pitrilysin family protein [Pseudomonas viridiflava]MEE4048338.1 pitrilysin family protein [Pseudomonas viridiflava]
MNILAQRALPSATSAANPQPTHEFTLDNGLKVIVREDHRAPVAISQLWYKVGSSYEMPGQTGLSHALEHMMFKGSSKTGPGEFSLILNSLGAEENAFTSDDCTVYHQELACDRLSVALELEADRMTTLTLPPDEFSREIEVIKEERRMRTDDDPKAKALERFNALAFPSSGYHNPTIGWMADLERMQVEELRHWYEAWYAPNNATLVVVGDVQPCEIKALAERFFGPIPRREVPASKRPLELAEPGERKITLHLETQLPKLFYGFNVPGLATAEDQRSANALRMIAALLGDGNSARIPARLVRGEELVSEASSSYDAFTRGDSLFMISAIPNTQKNKSLTDVETGIWRLLDDLKTIPVHAEELERIQAHIVANMVYERDLISSQATTLGRLETVGLPLQLMDGELESLRNVTPQDIQNAANTYFIRERLSIAYVLPEEKAR